MKKLRTANAYQRCIFFEYSGRTGAVLTKREDDATVLTYENRLRMGRTFLILTPRHDLEVMYGVPLFLTSGPLWPSLSLDSRILRLILRVVARKASVTAGE